MRLQSSCIPLDEVRVVVPLWKLLPCWKWDIGSRSLRVGSSNLRRQSDKVIAGMSRVESSHLRLQPDGSNRWHESGRVIFGSSRMKLNYLLVRHSAKSRFLFNTKQRVIKCLFLNVFNNLSFIMLNGTREPSAVPCNYLNCLPLKRRCLERAMFKRYWFVVTIDNQCKGT